jgi:murein DD-endopeptidase MepM/ murein hydrolase activator NlpD
MPNPVAKPKISQPWGRPNDRYKAKRHTGIDYAMPVGTPVLAVADGVISNVMTDASYGEVVVLKADKYEIWYCHLSVKGVKKGDKISVGQEIGKSGNTGNSSGPHLHLETRVAPFRYGNDVSCPFIEDAAAIDPNAPKDRKMKLVARVIAKVTPAKK